VAKLKQATKLSRRTTNQSLAPLLWIRKSWTKEKRSQTSEVSNFIEDANRD